MLNKIKLFFKNHTANILTFLNLTLGCLSIIFAFENRFFLAAILILVGTLLDRCDGKVARKLEATSIFGEELDSLADLITFGLAPSLLLWAIQLHKLHILGMIVCIIYILAGAFRLARFNSSEKNGIFIGVPITIAGGLLAILDLLAKRFTINNYIVLAIILILAYTMVTPRIKINKI